MGNPIGLELLPIVASGEAGLPPNPRSLRIVNHRLDGALTSPYFFSASFGDSTSMPRAAPTAA
jgi:hypothetical protein